MCIYLPLRQPVTFLLNIVSLVTVKHEGFKTCEQSGFCKRNRAYADNVATLGNSWTSPYTLSSKTLKIDNGYITATLLKSLGQGVQSVELPVKITFLQSGAARITVDGKEKSSLDMEAKFEKSDTMKRQNGLLLAERSRTGPLKRIHLRRRRSSNMVPTIATGQS